MFNCPTVDPGPWVQSLLTTLVMWFILAIILLIAIAGVWMLNSTIGSE